MAKDAINQYDNVAANNTDVGGVDTSSTMAPSDVNDAVRELMSHLADVDDGTSSLTSPDINGGTIDGAVIGGSSAAAGTFTTFTSTGIDDNASSTAVTIDSSQNVGIGTTAQAQKLEVSGAIVALGAASSYTNTGLYLQNKGSSVFDVGAWRSGASVAELSFSTDSGSDASPVERMRLTSAGRLGISNTVPAGPLEVMDVNINGSSGENGFLVGTGGRIDMTTDNGTALNMNDTSSAAGTHNYIVFRYQGTTIGDIDTTDNSTIRYNTFTGAHWAQFTDHSQPDIPLGTVMSTINQMCNYTQFEYVDEQGQTQKVDIAGSFEIGSTHTIYIDEDGAQAEGTAISQRTHKRLAKVKVSDVAGDKAVYGVFAGHYKDGDSSVESLGLGAIRIASGVTVENGDLLESAGDGTARPQTGDSADLFKASTIAKVTSTNVIEAYDDGSFTVPCTLHCG